MADDKDVILWRAPPSECKDPERELREGFDANAYPGDGPYFATYRKIAEEFRRCYDNGMQEIHLSPAVFEQLVAQGVMQPDGYYPDGESWHVPPHELARFNAAVRQGTGNRFLPEK